MTAKNILFIITINLGVDNFSLYTRWENDASEDRPILGVSELAKYIYLILVGVRMVANILALKWPTICQLTFYLELMITFVTSFMPIDVSHEREIIFSLLIIYINFILSYFNWKSDIILSVLSLGPCYIGRSIF